MIGDQRSVGLWIADCGLRIADLFRLAVSLTPRLLVSLSFRLRRGERGERDELQSALGSDEQAFASQFCRHGREQHPAQLPSLDLEFGVRFGDQFAATWPADVISRSQQLIDALRRHFDLNALWQEMALDAV